MKIAVCSDLHLEFGSLELKNTEQADVLILSGDICVERDLWDHDDALGSKKSTMLHAFFQNCSKDFAHVLYVAGNHEHYHGDFAYTLKELKRKLAYLPNIHVLDKETFELDDVVFVGFTLWTDMNKGDPSTLFHMKTCMNDFRCVVNSNKMVSRRVPLYKRNEDGTYFYDENKRLVESGYKFKEDPSTFSPQDAMEEHNLSIDYLKAVLENTPPWKSVVVVGHHTPCHFSCHPRYAHDRLMNGGYHSDLTEIMLDNEQIKLWTHGHTHDHFDYMIGSTRVVCNPRGYVSYEEIADNFKLKVVEV